MTQFLDLVRHEFKVSIRRPGLWIAYGLLMVFYTGSLLLPGTGPGGDVSSESTIPLANLWQFAGMFTFQFNIFLPIVVGILAADRMQRDFRLGVRELQNSTPLSPGTYISGKYLGVLASMFLPVFAWIIGLGVLLPALRLAPWEMTYALPTACLAIILPAFAFVTAFALACPLIMPLRVFQVLFVGYWFWGNFLSPEAFPTLNGTLLTAGGMLAYEGFFGGFPLASPDQLRYTAGYAGLNLVVLALCVIAVLAVLYAYLGRKARQA
jgi:ABC-type transport system involved in multi-copper enzyme maturation permease subunit